MITLKKERATWHVTVDGTVRCKGKFRKAIRFLKKHFKEKSK